MGGNNAIDALFGRGKQHKSFGGMSSSDDNNGVVIVHCCNRIMPIDLLARL